MHVLHSTSLAQFYLSTTEPQQKIENNIETIQSRFLTTTIIFYLRLWSHATGLRKCPG